MKRLDGKEISDGQLYRVPVAARAVHFDRGRLVAIHCGDPVVVAVMRLLPWTDVIAHLEPVDVAADRRLRQMPLVDQTEAHPALQGILRGFDVLEAAGALSLEERVLQEDLIDLLAGGNAPQIEVA